MSMIPKPSETALRAMGALVAVNPKHIYPLEWWRKEIYLLAPETRHSVQKELAIIFAHNMYGISKFAQSLKVNKTKYPQEFNSILFDFLLPMHRALINRGAWDEAIDLERILYGGFIKQFEDHNHYEIVFGELFSPYTKLFEEVNSPKNLAYSSKTTSIASSESATLFWFQNYSILAHTQLVLDLAKNLSIETKLYASALGNDDLEKSLSFFTQAGIEILSLNDQQNYRARCDELIKICISKNISNIVFVSLPLQSGYIKTICKNISLIWWSMKYPLGCIPHFDRLVCNRTLYPKQKIINGALWQCAPFALKAMPPHPNPHPLSMAKTDLSVGVLSRVEKFASSQLPEILNRCLVDIPNLQIFWTGKSPDPVLASRLHGPTVNGARQQVHFAGWVDPALFLTQIDLLIDTPNLGGSAAYWAMSMGKVVISATDSGSIGALGSQHELQAHFVLLSSAEEIQEYFQGMSTKPYYLSNPELTSFCLNRYANQKDLLKEHGQRFLNFFTNALSDMDRWSLITYQMLIGSYPK